MLKVSRMTDYAILLLTQFAPDAAVPKTARDLSGETNLPLPTVGKLLKLLCKDGFLESVRGVRGGYKLSRDPASVTLAEIVSQFDGEIELTQCVAHESNCAVRSKCRTRPHWSAINQVIQNALASRTLADLQRGPA